MLIGNGFGNWKSQSGLVLVVLSIPLLAKCGGATGGATVSTGGAPGGSGITSAGGSAGLSGAGGATTLPLDAGLSCSISVSQFDNTCNSDSDCVGVPEGNPCICGCSMCPTAALNVKAADQYLVDFKALSPTQCGSVVCNCPCIAGPCCRSGHCYNDCGMCSLPNN